MKALAYRPAPDLLEVEKGRRTVDLFDDYFRPEGVALELHGSHGRSVSFEAEKVWIFNPLFSSPKLCKYFSWIEDALINPEMIARQQVQPRPVEIFVAPYSSDDGRCVFAVRCYVTSDDADHPIVRPFKTEIVRAQDVGDGRLEEWLTKYTTSKIVWSRKPLEGINKSREPEEVPIPSLLGEGEKLLIVGPRTTNLPAWLWDRSEVIVWPSTEGQGATPDPPDSVRFVILTRFISHKRSDRIRGWAYERAVPVEWASTGEIRRRCEPWKR